MDKKIAEEILSINNDTSLSYEDKINKMQSVGGELFETHKNILTGKPYAKRNQYILEAFRTLNNFKTTNWIPSDKISENQKPQTTPVEYEIVTIKNETIKYSLYNEEQIQNSTSEDYSEDYNVSRYTYDNMKKYTANYSYSNSNFVIQNLPHNKIKNKYYQAICILKNILQRGNPTLTSTFLQEHLGKLHERKDFEQAYPLITKDIPNWKWTIKGNEENNLYPAKDFYYKNIPNDLEDCKFIQQLLIPEVKIAEIVNDLSSEAEEFTNQCVDFYLPPIKLVIEIDGSQHKEKEQNAFDKKRDEYLLRHKIETIRISTEELNTQNSDYFDKLKQIRKKITDLYYIQNNSSNETLIKIDDYKKVYLNGINLNNPNYIATAIIRFQILILELLSQDILDFDTEWNLEILCRDIKDFAQVAIDDLFIWFEQLFLLMNINIKKPNIKITYVNSEREFSLTDSIKIDFSLLKRYTDENKLAPNTIFVRTDYFDENDYFEISVADLIKYPITIDKAEKPLLFFAWNLFLQSNKNLTFDILEFREGQLDIIVNALNRRHTIGLLPTGSGKSICYQLACFLQPAISFVVCPIKSLMVDQSQDLHNAYISRVNAVTSDNTAQEKQRVQLEYKQGKYFFIFISPERFQIKKFRAYLSDINKHYNIAYAVIDEAHCMSEWGHDFRTSYLNLVYAIKYYCSNFSFIALSATASSNVLKDLRIELNLDNEDDIKTPKEYCRKELEFFVINDKQNKYKVLTDLINNYKQDEFYNDKCGIIFTPTVNSNPKKGVIGCYDLSCLLSDKQTTEDKKEIVPFFSGSEPRDFSGGNFSDYKQKIQTGFKSNKYKLLVATKAFGMGVNKGNIGYTVHFGLPASMESFYQEAGRAGREKSLFKNTKAKCTVLISPIDLEIPNENVDIEDVSHLTQNTMDKLWNPDSNYELVQKISKNLYGDLSTQMFFFISEENSIKSDVEIIYKMYEFIKSKNCNNVLINNPKMFLYDKFDDIEKYIFKLKQLGIVKDWTVDFISNQYELIIGSTSVNNILNNVENSIKKYDKEFSFAKLSDEKNKYYKNLKVIYNDESENNDIKKCITILLQWNYDTFAYGRRKSLSTVYENCMKVANNEMSKEEFKTTIENYFRFSNKAHIFQYIADNPKDYKKWFEIFYIFQDSIQTEHIIDIKEAQNLIGTLSRFLESYMHNTGLDYISGFLRLIVNDYEHLDGKSRFESSLNEISNYDKKEQSEIIVNTLNIAQQILNKEQKNIISKALTDNLSNDKDMLYKIYNKLNDDNSLFIVSGDFLNRIDNIKKKIEVNNES